MAISLTRYVSITSGVGGGAAVPTRALIARLFTTNELAPTKAILEFDTADDVRAWFGSDSEEYKQALFYFGFLSKNITRPKQISFVRWADVATAAQIFGDATNTETDLDEYTAINAGSLQIGIGGALVNVSGVDLSLAASLADVASIVQAAIVAVGAPYDTVTVTYNATPGRFELDSGAAGPQTIDIVDGPELLLQLMGWTSALTVISEGVAAETVTDVISESSDQSNNFGSFKFMETLTEDQHVEVAQWNKAQNNMFLYIVPVTATNASDLSAALIDIGGTSLELTDSSLGEYHEILPMAILAATNYEARNSVQNFMFYQAALTPLVTTNTAANVYDDLRVNYYGETQTAGQKIAFYQRGRLCGLATDPVDTNTYANEIWFKDFTGSQIMGLLLSLAKVSANRTGRGQLMLVVSAAIDQALLNGTISVGKTLNTTQQIFITEQSGDPLAYVQVQNKGYWFDLNFVDRPASGGGTEKVASYTVIYSKDDVVRKVEGTHTLI